MSNETIFSSFISGEIPVHVIHQDETTFAFLDQNPVTEGHSLVIPKEPINHLDDCDDALYLQIFSTVRTVSRLLKQRLTPERIALVVHGYEIPHAHVHVIPVYHHGDNKFPKRPDRLLPYEELLGTFEKLVNKSTDEN